MMNKNKKMLIISAIVATILITLGVTYAFFRYSDSGVMQNSVQAGTIKFIYNESNREGNGISLEEALPMSDEVGKTQDTYFDFSVKGTTNTFELPYEITLRKTTSSDSIDNAVKMYLTEIVGGIETEKVLTMYNSLGYSSNELALINHENHY